MRRFFKNLLIFCIIPIFVVIMSIVPYVRIDPYADFGKNNDYSWKYYFQQLGDLSTKKLLKSNQPYNAFIFGSSRTTSVYACYLNEKLPDAQFFHYGNWNESIGGICSKLQLLDEKGYAINRVILYFDTDYTFKDAGACLPSDHYLLTHQSRFSYLNDHFKSYYKNFSMDKLKILSGIPVAGETYPNWHSDPITNDPNHDCSDEQVRLAYGTVQNTPAYREKIDSLRRSGFLYNRTTIQQYLPRQISKIEQGYLQQIKAIFEKHATQYAVVLTPLYDQNKFSKADESVLNTLFKGHVYDYTGINSITNSVYNYPDRKHFQNYISKNMLDSILIRQTLH